MSDTKKDNLQNLSREERLANSLRDNLRRRKQAARKVKNSKQEDTNSLPNS